MSSDTPPYNGEKSITIGRKYPIMQVVYRGDVAEIEQDGARFTLHKDRVYGLVRRWPCSYEGQPHPIKALSKVSIECPTQDRFYALIESLMDSATGHDEAVTAILDGFEAWKKIEKAVTYYGGSEAMLDELRTLEKGKRAVKKAQQFFAENEVMR